jgi:hypothetical protein
MPRRFRRAAEKMMRKFRKRRAAAKRAKKYSRVPGGALQLKPYTFSFKPQPQSVISNLIAPGGVSISPSSTQAPFNSTNFALRSNTLSPAITTVTDWAMACTFQLTDLNSYAAFAAMYDAYKINYVTVTLQYLSNSAQTNSTSLLPTFYVYADQDDVVVPVSASQISGKQGIKKWQPTATKLMKSFRIRPTTLSTVEGAVSTSTVNANVPNKQMWLDCVDASVPHFGCKIYCQDWTAQGSTSALNVVRIHYTYNVSFRSPLVTS